MDLKNHTKIIFLEIFSNWIKKLNNIESRFKSLKKQLTDPIKVNIKADFDGFGEGVPPRKAGYGTFHDA